MKSWRRPLRIPVSRRTFGKLMKAIKPTHHTPTNQHNREFIAAVWPVEDTSRSVTGQRLIDMYNSLSKKKAQETPDRNGHSATATTA